MFKVFFRILLVGLVALPIGCSLLLASAEWRYRMTVEIETPEGIKTGSAVREVIVKQGWSIYGSRVTPRPKFKGEAVVVDLGERGQVYALMRGFSGVDYAYNVVYGAFPPPPGIAPHIPKGIRYYGKLKGAKAELKEYNMPMMVTFADRQDPMSVQLVYQSQPLGPYREEDLRQGKYTVTDNFEDVFGEGVRLHRVTLEMTNDAITTGIIKWLPWLSQIQGSYLHGGKTARGAPLGLYGSNFKVEGL